MFSYRSFWDVEISSTVRKDLLWEFSYKDDAGRDCWKMALADAIKHEGDIWDRVDVVYRPDGGWGEHFTVYVGPDHTEAMCHSLGEV